MCCVRMVGIHYYLFNFAELSVSQSFSCVTFLTGPHKGLDAVIKAGLFLRISLFSCWPGRISSSYLTSVLNVCAVLPYADLYLGAFPPLGGWLAKHIPIFLLDIYKYADTLHTKPLKMLTKHHTLFLSFYSCPRRLMQAYSIISWDICESSTIHGAVRSRVSSFRAHRQLREDSYMKKKLYGRA